MNNCNGNGKWNPSTQKCDCYYQTTPNFDGTNIAIGTWYGDYCEQGTNICTNPQPCNDPRNYNIPQSDACKLCGDTDPCLLPGEAKPGKAKVWRDRNVGTKKVPDEYCCTTEKGCSIPIKTCEATHNCCGDLNLPCKNFEHCNGTSCVLNSGMCYTDIDCPNGSECNTYINKCIKKQNYCNGNGVWNPSTQKCDCYKQTTPNYDGTDVEIGTWYGDYCERGTNICTNPQPCHDDRNSNLPKSDACKLCGDTDPCLARGNSKPNGSKVWRQREAGGIPDQYCCTTEKGCYSDSVCNGLGIVQYDGTCNYVCNKKFPRCKKCGGNVKDFNSLTCLEYINPND
jgi:hypothetical protein